MTSQLFCKKGGRGGKGRRRGREGEGKEGKGEEKSKLQLVTMKLVYLYSRKQRKWEEKAILLKGFM